MHSQQLPTWESTIKERADFLFRLKLWQRWFQQLWEWRRRWGGGGCNWRPKWWVTPWIIRASDPQETKKKGKEGLMRKRTSEECSEEDSKGEEAPSSATAPEPKKGKPKTWVIPSLFNCSWDHSCLFLCFASWALGLFWDFRLIFCLDENHIQLQWCFSCTLSKWWADSSREWLPFTFDCSGLGRCFKC